MQERAAIFKAALLATTTVGDFAPPEDNKGKITKVSNNVTLQQVVLLFQPQAPLYYRSWEIYSVSLLDI